MESEPILGCALERCGWERRRFLEIIIWIMSSRRDAQREGGTGRGFSGRVDLVIEADDFDLEDIIRDRE
jgi:hypothetical protein